MRISLIGVSALVLSGSLSLAADAPAPGKGADAPAPAKAPAVGESYSGERQKNEDAERKKAMAVQNKPVPKYDTAGWKMVWSEEFDGDRLNPEVWGHEIGFVRNHEPQYYTDRPENVCVKDGCLVITARKEKFPNAKFGVKGSGYREGIKEAEYTSGSVTTQRKKSFHYGRLEIRAQMPSTRGAWPALWLLGDRMNLKGGEYLNWPACGEIDFLEIWCSSERGRGRLTSVLHTSTEPRPDKAPHKAFGGGDMWNQKPSEGFHTYTMDWDRDWIYFYYDGKNYGKCELARGDWKNGDNPFRHPFFLIINLALGGYGNAPDATSVFPDTLKVDWIRHYQRDDAGTGAKADTAKGK